MSVGSSEAQTAPPACTLRQATSPLPLWLGYATSPPDTTFPESPETCRVSNRMTAQENCLPLET
jgi:hypothetical protein